MRLDLTDKKISVLKFPTAPKSDATTPRAQPQARGAVDSFTPSAPRSAARAALLGLPSGGGSGFTYTVQAGDTLTAIAARYGTTVDAIVRANNIPNPDRIYVGQQLWIPQDNPPPPPPPPTPTGTLSNEPNHQFSLNETWPFIKKYSQQYGMDSHVLAGMMQQESGFKNYLVHFDGTGHGLLGLDDNGLLPDFERWVQTNKGQPGYSAGRGAGARSIPPEWQIEYAAQKLASYSRAYGGAYNAARAWYAGPGGMSGPNGAYYEGLIRNHVANLFRNGEPPDTLPTPPTGTGTFGSTADANRVFLTQWGPTAYNDKGPIYGFNDCGPTSGAMVLQAVGLMPQAGASGASAAIDKVRDAVLGWDSSQSVLMNMNQLSTGLQRLGARTTFLGGDPVSAVEQSLSRGHPAILGGGGVWAAWGAAQRAAGNYINSGDPHGHFVTVLGKNQANGNYIVGDPLVRGGTIEVNANQLRTFYAGGFGVLEVENPNPPPPPPSGNKVSFQAANGQYLAAQNYTMNAAAAGPGGDASFDVVDLNGGGLESGDAINIKTANGMYMVAEFGGGDGSVVNANRPAAGPWEQFRIVEIGGDGHIQEGDQVALQAWDGQHWVCAENGGGSNVVANRTAAGPWETFTYHKS